MNDPRARAKGPPTRANGDLGAMAQLVAHLLCKQGVRGSSPLGSTGKVPSHGHAPMSSVGTAQAGVSREFHTTLEMAAPKPLAAV